MKQFLFQKIVPYISIIFAYYDIIDCKKQKYQDDYLCYNYPSLLCRHIKKKR